MAGDRVGRFNRRHRLPQGNRIRANPTVTPAKAGVQGSQTGLSVNGTVRSGPWIPAFAGMTGLL